MSQTLFHGLAHNHRQSQRGLQQRTHFVTVSTKQRALEFGLKRIPQEHRLFRARVDVEFFNPKDPARTVRRYRSSQFRPDRIAFGWMPAHPALFLHRRVYERYGNFRSDYRIAGDFEYCARIFHANTLAYRSLSETLVRMRTGGISTRGWRNTALLNREVLRACRENGIDTNMFKIFSKYPAKLLEFLVK
jgi:hypothetical protein